MWGKQQNEFLQEKKTTLHFQKMLMIDFFLKLTKSLKNMDPFVFFLISP